MAVAHGAHYPYPVVAAWQSILLLMAAGWHMTKERAQRIAFGVHNGTHGRSYLANAAMAADVEAVVGELRRQARAAASQVHCWNLCMLSHAEPVRE